MQDSWLSRLAGSFKSVAFGGLVVCGALPAMWCNEGRAVTTARSLEEGAGVVISASSDAVDPANEGRLVHVVGRADTPETVRDPDLGVAATAIRLVRTTEMYQWKEHERTVRRVRPSGGQSEEEKEYTYHKEWSEHEISSGSFHSSSAPRNPGPVPFSSTAFSAQAVTLGAFSLPAELVAKMKAVEPLPLSGSPSESRPGGLRRTGDTLYRGRDPEHPEIGDLRVRYGVVRPQVVSVVAGQSGRGFRPYQTHSGDALSMLEAGERPAASMFQAAVAVNRVLTWILRAGAYFFVAFGIFLVFRPVAVLGEAVPLVGGLLGAGLWLFSFGLGAVLSFATIATAWVFYRPLFGVALLVAIGATVVWLRRRAGPAAPAPR